MSRLASVLTNAGRLLNWLATTLGRILAALIGEVHWQAPAWGRRTGGWLARGGTAIAARPARSAVVAAIAVALAVGGWHGWQVWQARPQPVKVQFSVAEVPRTQIE